MISVSIANILRSVKVIEEDVTVLTTGCEAHIVWEPVDAHDAAHVPSELHVSRVVSSVEVVDVDVLARVALNTCEQVTSV